jgi:hypothetical protein
VLIDGAVLIKTRKFSSPDADIKIGTEHISTEGDFRGSESVLGSLMTLLVPRLRLPFKLKTVMLLMLNFSNPSRTHVVMLLRLCLGLARFNYRCAHSLSKRRS